MSQVNERITTLESKHDRLSQDLSELKGMIKSRQEQDQVFWQKDWSPLISSQRDHELRIQKLETAVSLFQTTPSELAKINSKLDLVAKLEPRISVLESRDNTYLVKKIESIEVNISRQADTVQALQYQQIYWTGGSAVAVFLIAILSRHILDWLQGVGRVKHKVENDKP